MTEPFVSVVVPVRNEERHIERCLYSIARQDYPRERFEVIVVDGMSDDATRAIIGRFAAESTIDLRLLENRLHLPAPAMNIGVRAARGEVIVRCDGHAALAPDYLRRCVQGLEATGADCAGGTITSEGESYLGQAIALAMSSRFGVGGAAFRVGGPPGETDTVAFGAYRREVFERIGGFAEDIPAGEDDEFNYRLRESGGRIVLLPEIRAMYTVRAGLPALWRQYFAYGRAKVEVLRRHPGQAQARQFVPAALVLALAASISPEGRKFVSFRWLALVYTGAATIASLVLAARNGWRYFPPLPAAFACLHVSYGLGSLAGIVGLAGRTLAQRVAPGVRQSTEAPDPRRG